MTSTKVSEEPRIFNVLQLAKSSLEPELQHDINRGTISTAVELYNLGFYRKVATVRTENINQVFLLTQGDLETNPGVSPVFGMPLRSTDVGDIIVEDDGQSYLVTPTGYEPIPIVLKTEDFAL